MTTTPAGFTSGTGSTKASQKRLIDALIALSLKVARKIGDDTDIEGRIEVYAQQLASWPEPIALAVLAEHPRRSIYWPAWKELEDLRVEHEQRQRERQAWLPSPDGERFAERATRLRLHARLARIGAAKYGVVMDRHRSLSDAQVVAAVERLERGRPAFAEDDPHALFTTRREWDDFQQAMASLRDPTVPSEGREVLLAIGAGIEGRQRPNAVARGWA